MKTLDEYLELAGRAHGHLCAGQVLGVRMAMYGLGLLGIADPEAERKRLVTFVEIDRCATDAIQVVTGCRFGKRALKFRDFGKMAATFCDLREGRAFRIAARDSARLRARELHCDLENANEREMLAYRELPDSELFLARAVRVHVAPEDLPGFKAPRVACSRCGEGISFRREVVRDGVTLCRACAGEAYYELVD
ncbi:MAG: FmdE family protein [bacterium]|jgi:formylmethanofuran dehydrogenase subunit E